jgi:RNA polymerase sigma-70 factor (ECF subfamily)
VSEIVGIPLATVKSRMFYARKQLARILVSAGVEAKPV